MPASHRRTNRVKITLAALFVGSIILLLLEAVEYLSDGGLETLRTPGRRSKGDHNHPSKSSLGHLDWGLCGRGRVQRDVTQPTANLNASCTCGIEFCETCSYDPQYNLPGVCYRCGSGKYLLRSLNKCVEDCSKFGLISDMQPSAMVSAFDPPKNGDLTICHARGYGGCVCSPL